MEKPIGLPWVPLRFSLSPDGTQVALMNSTGFEVWDAQRQISVGGLTNHGVPSSLRWHPAGHQLALGFDSGEILLWNPETGHQKMFFGEPQFAANLDFNREGMLLLSGHWGNLSQLWDLATGHRVVLQLNGFGVHFTPDGRHLGWMSEDGHFGKWRVEGPASCQLIGPPTRGEKIRAIAFSPSADLLACTQSTGVTVWNLRQRRELASVDAGVLTSDSALAFTVDGQSVLTSDRNQFLQWPILPEEGPLGLQVGGPHPLATEEALPLVSLFQDSQQIPVFPRQQLGGFGGVVQVIDRSNPTNVWKLTNFPPGSYYSLSPTTNWIVIGSSQPYIRDFARNTTWPLETTFGKGFVLFSPDGERVIHTGNGLLEIFEAKSGKTLRSRSQKLAGPSFSHDGRVLALGNTTSPNVWLINSANGGEVAQLIPADNNPVFFVAFSPDDQTLAVSHGNFIRLWDLRELHRQLAQLGLTW